IRLDRQFRQRRQQRVLHALGLARRQRQRVVQVNKRLQQRAHLLVDCLLRLVRSSLGLLQGIQRGRQLAQRYSVHLLPGPHRLRLQVDLVPYREELAQQRVQIDGLGRRNRGGRAVNRRRDGLFKPAAKVGEEGVDRLGGQGLRRTLSSVDRDTRRRGLRHVSSSISESMLSFLPASNSR